MRQPIPHPLFRWQLGLLSQGLARRLIPRSLGDLPPRGADDALPQPVGQAHSRQGRRLSDQGVVLWQDPYSERDGMDTGFFFLRSSHADMVSPMGIQVKIKESRLDHLTT
jgi:hypothetical protein